MQLLVTPGLILAYSPEHRQVMITIMKPHTASSPILQIYCTLCSGSEEHLMRDTREHKSVPWCYNQRVTHCSPARGGVSNYLFSWRINTNNYPGEGAPSTEPPPARPSDISVFSSCKLEAAMRLFLLSQALVGHPAIFMFLDGRNQIF